MRQYSKERYVWPNGRVQYTFDVIDKSLWNDGKVLQYSLSRVIVAGSGITVMRFHSDRSDGGWLKADNPYAGISLTAEEMQHVKSAVTEIFG